MQLYQCANHSICLKIQNTAMVEDICLPLHNYIPSSSLVTCCFKFGTYHSHVFHSHYSSILSIDVCMAKQYVSFSYVFLNLI